MTTHGGVEKWYHSYFNFAVSGNEGYIYAVAALPPGENLLVPIKYATGLEP
jgi:hypothetical protein